jgi:hypothetical protein
MENITKKNSLENLIQQRENIIKKFGEAYVPAKLNEEIHQLQTVPAYEKLVEEIINDLKLGISLTTPAEGMTTASLTGSKVNVRFQVKNIGICVCFGYGETGVWERAILLTNKLNETPVSFGKFGYEVEAEVAYLKDRIRDKMLDFLAANH